MLETQSLTLPGTAAEAYVRRIVTAYAMTNDFE
jgi:hypothetical protein